MAVGRTPEPPSALRDWIRRERVAARASGEAGAGGDRGGSKCCDMKARGWEAREVKEASLHLEDESGGAGEEPRSSREVRIEGMVERPWARRRNWSSAKRRKTMKGLSSSSF